jgi:hypothetical protein
MTGQRKTSASPSHTPTPVPPPIGEKQFQIPVDDDDDGDADIFNLNWADIRSIGSLFGADAEEWARPLSLVGIQTRNSQSSNTQFGHYTDSVTYAHGIKL